jgi:predicted HAD superfamily phosphohydrolase YqeG
MAMIKVREMMSSDEALALSKEFDEKNVGFRAAPDGTLFYAPDTTRKKLLGIMKKAGYEITGEKEGDYTFHLKNKKEGLSKDKLTSLVELMAGTRSKDFDAFLEKAPTEEELQALAEKLEKPEIESVIFDLDGTLVSPYAEIPDEVIALLTTYVNTGKKVIIFTHSKHTSRLDKLRDAGIFIAQTQTGKPSLSAFQEICETHKIDPQTTAMIGNFPVTDMPLVERGSKPFFPLNILIKSIPPQRNLIESTAKFIRAELFHAISISAVEIVRAKNIKMISSIPEEKVRQ